MNNITDPFTSDFINQVSDFVSNTSEHTKVYVLAVGAIASFSLLNYSVPAKTWALVGRCTSLFMASELLYTQRDQSWEKIAVTALKTISICLGIASIALSSPTLLINSLICDVVGQAGALALAICDLNTTPEKIAQLLLALIIDLLVLGAISTASADLLFASAIISWIGSYVCILST